MSRSVELQLGVNGAFCARRWEQPGSWMRLTKELGYPAHEFCADVLDPFFSGDLPFQLDMARKTRAAAEEHGVTLTGIYTGAVTRRFHGLSHSDPIPRQRMVDWVCDSMDLARAMGCDRVGGRWDVIPLEVMEQGEHAYHTAIKRQQEILRELAQIGRDKGLAALHVEQSCVPAEVPWTLKQTEELLIEVNRGQSGCPVYVTLDVGRVAGHHYGLSGNELDHLEWLRRFAAWAETIHLQQTTPQASHHWPFTEEFNARGHIRLEPILEAIQVSHQAAHESWVSEVMPPVERTWLIADIIPGAMTNEATLLGHLKASAEYLKQYLPEGKLTLSV